MQNLKGEIMITDESPSGKRSLKTLTMKRILSNNIDSALDSWTQCNYFMAKKNRFCNMAKSNNSNYCGNHRPNDEAPPARVLKKMREHSSTDQNKVPDLDARIPCPIDPSHTIYKHNLDQHLKICNTKIRIEQLEKFDYYCKNCNTSGIIADEALSGNCEEELNLEHLILKIDKVFDDLVSPNIVDTLSNVSEISSRDVNTVLNELVASQSAFDRVRHVKQDACIINKMIDFKLIVPNDENDSKNQSNEVYIEFGAGKGLLGLSISMVRPLSTIIMVERSGMRRKADKLLREYGRNFHRFRMDIRDVSLCQLPGIDLKNISSPSEKRCILVAKHLCGVATDFALWSFENLSKEFENNSRGLAIATCCHHACQYHDFYGKKCISEHGFSRSEFNLMCRWSGWANTYNNSSDDYSKKKDHDQPTSSAPRPPGLEPSRQSNIGFKIKRIFDYCRVEALKNIGYNCELARYCTPDLSPENYVIIARQLI